MRSFHYVLFCLAFVLCLHSVTAVPHQALRRQGDSSARPSATSALSQVSSTAKSDQASSTVEASAKPSSATTPNPLTQVPVTASAPVPGSTSSAVANVNNPLPIHPKVTPAIGITGALLLITGLVYAVIGIKNKWIHVFGSAAYLTALAVTVLIIYLMSPPVSDGVQGAFFVAAFFTGLIFGVLSLVFSDISEGFGCLLGGFCLSMWFLSLKSGGLIGSTTGRAIFIGCMSAGGYSLSFSHHTRNYGLIASISFSGATATMLGIDCLAKGGWKEFWIYLWNLNDALFPLNTDTYPLTKNIKAELAGVVIIAIFGAVSQLRVWNMVKEHREKSAEQELQKQQEQEREETARGREVEGSFRRERAQWEAQFGNKSFQDSSKHSSIASPKGSASIEEKEVDATDSLEMVSLNKSGVAAAGTTVTVSVPRDDAIQQIDAQGNPISDKTSELSNKLPGIENRLSHQSTSLSPQLVRLPSTISRDENAKSQDVDTASVSAVPELQQAENEGHRPMSKRISDMSITRRFSGRRSRAFSESEQVLVTIGQVEEDRASSIAATLDEDDENKSLHELSSHRTPFQDAPEAFPKPADSPKEDPNSIHRQTSVDALGTKAGKTARETHTNDQRPSLPQSLTSSTDPKPGDTAANRVSLRDSRIRVDTLVSKNGSEQGSNGHESHATSIGDGVLPARLSKVALSYRTNEWAKHLEAAEKPDIEELRVTPPPDIILEEAPAPVSDDIAYPLTGSRRVSQRKSTDPALNGAFAQSRSQSRLSQNSLSDQRAITQTPTGISPAVLSRSNSAAQLNALAPLPSNTLIGQRETLMWRRTSSQSVNNPSSSALNLLEQAEQEQMSLAQRRQVLQHHQAPLSGLIHQTSTTRKATPPSASQKWQNKGWAGKSTPSGFDSHQPRRTTSTQSEQKREELFADWRNNIQEVTTPQTQAYIAEQQRKALINERRQKELEKQQREAAQQQRTSKMDSMMRSGHMLDAHREAIRKMQANANRHAS